MIECNSGNIFRSRSGAVVIAPGPGKKKKSWVFSGDQTETNTVLNWIAEFFLSHRCCCDGYSLYTAVTHVWRSGPFACNSQKASLHTGCAVGLLWTHLRLGLETASTDAARDVWSGVVMEINIKGKRKKTVYSKLIKTSIISKYLFKPHLTCRVLGSTVGCETTAHPLWQCFSTTVCNFTSLV